MTTLSVVIPAHNPPDGWVPVQGSARFGSSLSRSIQSQEVAVNFTVVDDASDSASVQSLVRALSQIAPTELVRSSVNLGAGGARMLGLAQAPGDYVFFADADDLVLLPDLMVAARVAGARSLEFLHVGTETMPWGSRFSGGGVSNRILIRERSLATLLVKQSSLWRFLFRADFARQLSSGFPSSSYGEDLEALLAILETRPTVMSWPRICYVHHLGVPGSASAAPAPDVVDHLQRRLLGIATTSTRTSTRALALWWILKIRAVRAKRLPGLVSPLARRSQADDGTDGSGESQR